MLTCWKYSRLLSGSSLEEVEVCTSLNSPQYELRLLADPLLGLKRTPMVLGSLLWQPFDVRFQELLDRMKTHKHNISEEIEVWKLKCDASERVATAKWREHTETEYEDADKERSLAQEERRLMAEERRIMETERGLNTEVREKISALLAEIQDGKAHLEQRRLGKHYTTPQKIKIKGSVAHTISPQGKQLQEFRNG
jgi:small-conductance mechanosensitive channel